jgi:hypothetical protein
LVEWNCKEKNSALPKCINEIGDTVYIEDICAQLATIYDIVGDMSMDRLRELVEADRDRRCVVMPKDYDGVLFRVWREKIISSGCFSWVMKELGKTMFPSREAAEAAIKGDQHGKDL